MIDRVGTRISRRDSVGRRGAEVRISAGRVVRRLVRGSRTHSSLLANSGSLAVTSLLTSVLGFVYWALAARLLPARVVGQQSGLVSAVTFVGTIGVLGSGSLLIAELPRRTKRSRSQLITTVSIGVAGISGLLAAISIIFLLRIGHLGAALKSPWVVIAFILGVISTSITMALDSATIGLLQGGLQMYRNFFMAVLKTLLLPLFIVLGGSLASNPAVYSWVLGSAVSVFALTLMANRRRISLWASPDWRDLGSIKRATFDHSALNLSVVVPRVAIPAIVASLYRPEQNAAFYVAWMVASIPFLIPHHLSTVLFAIGKGEYGELASKLKFTLGLSVALGAPAALAIALFAPVILGLFGPTYSASAAAILSLFCLAFPGNLFRSHYLAVARVQDQLPRAWRLMAVFGVAEFAAVLGVGAVAGLLTSVVVLVIVMSLEGAVVAPSVLRAASLARQPVESRSS